MIILGSPTTALTITSIILQLLPDQSTIVDHNDFLQFQAFIFLLFSQLK